MKPFPPEDILSAWFDREATPDEQQEILRRLDSAATGEQAATERALDEMELLSAALRNLPQQPVPTDLTNQILQQITSASPAETRPDGAIGPHIQPLPLHPLPLHPVADRKRSPWVTGMLPVGICVLALFVMVQLLDSPSAPPTTEPESLPSLAGSPDRDSLVSNATPPGEPHDYAWPKISSFQQGAGQNELAQNSQEPFRGAARQFTPSAQKRPMTGPNQLAELPAQTLAESSPRGNPRDSQFFRFYDDPTGLEVGQIVDAIQRQGDEVVVIQLTVVDLNQGLENLEVLLAHNNIPVRSSVDFTDHYYRELDRDQQTTSKKSESDTTPEQAAAREELLKEQRLRYGTKEAPVQLYALYVETSGEQLQAALKDIQQQKLLDSLAVNSPESLLALTPTNRQRVQSLAMASPESEKQWEQAEQPAQNGNAQLPEPAPSATRPPVTPKSADTQPENPLPKFGEQRGSEKDAEDRKPDQTPATQPPREEPNPGAAKAVPQAAVRLKTENEPAGPPKPSEEASGTPAPRPAETPAPSPPRSLSEPVPAEPVPTPAPANVPPQPPAEFKAPLAQPPAAPAADELPGSPRRANHLQYQTHESAEEKARKAAKKRLQIVFMIVPTPIPPLVPAAPAPNPAPGPR